MYVKCLLQRQNIQRLNYILNIKQSAKNKN